MNILKLKVAAPFVAIGASLLLSLIQWSDHHGLYWVWWVVAALCAVIVAMVEGVDNRFKAKLAVPCVLAGAAGLLLGLQTFSPDFTFELEAALLFGAVITASVVVVAMVKPSKPLTAS